MFPKGDKLGHWFVGDNSLHENVAVIRGFSSMNIEGIRCSIPPEYTDYYRERSSGNLKVANSKVRK